MQNLINRLILLVFIPILRVTVKAPAAWLNPERRAEITELLAEYDRKRAGHGA